MNQTDLNQKVHSLHSPNSMNLRDVSRSWNGTNSSRKGLNLGLLFCTETISIYNSQPQHLSHSRSPHRYLEFLLTDIRLPRKRPLISKYGKLHCSSIQLAFKVINVKEQTEYITSKLIIICSSVFSLLHRIQRLRENHRQIPHLTSCFDNKHHRSCFSNSSIIQTNKMLYMQGCHVHVIKRDLGEPGKIVKKLLQPQVYLKLINLDVENLSLASKVEEINVLISPDLQVLLLDLIPLQGHH